ncbi:MAG: hypothetical protein ACLP50_33740 [Solirubrobacteraceae bacterium]
MKERARILRLAGSVNHKTGRYARILEADFQLPAHRIGELVGDLPDPEPAVAVAPRARRGSEHQDPYKRISPPEYFEPLAGIDTPRGGLFSCPTAWHDDRHPSFRGHDAEPWGPRCPASPSSSVIGLSRKLVPASGASRPRLRVDEGTKKASVSKARSDSLLADYVSQCGDREI